MQYEEVTWYSERVHRDMTIRIYGHYGPAIIAFPCQDKQSDDFANNGMIDALSGLINQGRFKLYCLDANDEWTVSHKDWDHGKAAFEFEMYREYVAEEVLPFIRSRHGISELPFLVGASMGASHAANQFFRKPDLFSGFLALSGSFDLARFFYGYMDQNVYMNSPVHYLANIPGDHPYLDIYRQREMHAVVGKGDWEFLVSYTYPWLEGICNEKGIPVHFHYWDENAIHNWSSWHYEMNYFLEQLF